MNVAQFKHRYNFISFEKYFNHITIGGSVGSRKQKSYLKVYCGFDIETTKINDKTYPWHLQMQFNDDYITMRHVEEFVELIEFLNIKTTYSNHKAKAKLIIFIHNMAYEMAFLRKYIAWTNVFAKAKRHPVYMEYNNIVFMDSFLIENKSLKNLAIDYNLPNRKMSGDLDYSKHRNTKTPTTFTEARYNHNDVLILRDYAEHVFFPIYIEGQGFAPITNTQKVRQSMINYIEEHHGSVKRIKSKVAELFPNNITQYQLAFRYLFRGGYTHSNKLYTNIILRNLIGYDFTSSYPSVIFTRYFPLSKFKVVDINSTSWDHISHYLKTMCCIMTCRFTNIRSTTFHSIESASKCIELSGAHRDNGRVSSAESMTVMLTELDYQSYCDAYEWDEMELINMQISKRGRLPEYIIHPMLSFYKEKNVLKGVKGQEVTYMRSKGMLNSFYGCMVTRLVFEDVALDEEGNWIQIEGIRTYEKMCNNLLSPYWGIWVTAHARRNELKLLFQMKDVVYSDTDSHKCLKVHEEYNAQVIQDYNESIYCELKDACSFYSIDESVVIDSGGDMSLFDSKRKSLGFANYDGEYIAFKTLGAKRYIYLDQHFGRHVVVAGLPKGLYEKENHSIVRFFSEFRHGYTAKDCKLASVYFDEYSEDIVTDEFGNSEVMSIESGVTLESTDFTMSIESDYFELIKDNAVRYMLFNERILG